MADFIKPADLKVVFSVSDTIKGLHRDFLSNLEKRLEKPISGKGYYTLQVGDLFVQYAGLMPMYSSYVDNFDASNQKLAEVVKKNSKKFHALEEAAKKETGNLGLTDLLILPVQRLPRYLLLLQSLKEATLRSHKDFAMIAEAISSVGVVCTHINESKRKSEQGAALLALAKRCRNAKDLVQPARRLLQEWAVGDSEKYILLVLFSDGVGLFTGRNEHAHIKFKKMVPFGVIFEISRRDSELRFSDAKDSFAVKTPDEDIDVAIEAAWKQAVGSKLDPKIPTSCRRSSVTSKSSPAASPAASRGSSTPPSSPIGVPASTGTPPRPAKDGATLQAQGVSPPPRPSSKPSK